MFVRPTGLADHESDSPRSGLHPNRGFVEPGAFRTKRLRQSPTVEFYPWNSVSRVPKPKLKQKKVRSDGLERARSYQSLLDSGQCESRAALAGFPGVSRARVTQVPKRLNEQKSNIRVG